MMCEKIFSERAKFFCSRAAFKSSFFETFLVFEIMILYWIWARSDRNERFQVVNLSFMQI